MPSGGFEGEVRMAAWLRSPTGFSLVCPRRDFDGLALVLSRGGQGMLLQCQDCGIMISVSETGYGEDNRNVAVLLAPEAFATRWMTCGRCRQTYCVKCANKRKTFLRGTKCSCGGRLSEKDNIRV
jgi:hypothetical protein